MKKQYTLDDIARLAGVSKSTVSRVLTGSPAVKTATKDRVYRIIRETGYFHSLPASYAGDDQESRVIAVLIPNVRNQFWGKFTRLIQSSLFEKGYMPLLLSADFDAEAERRCLQLVHSTPIAAMIAVSHLEPEELESRYSALACPVTFLNQAPKHPNFSAIVQDNFQAGYIATKHLIEQGYERIAFICGPRVSPSIEQRLSGYKAALENSFIPVQESLIRYGDICVERGIAEADFICAEAKGEPLAVLLTNDETAIGLMDTCRARGLSIPGDLALVGFDNIDFSKLHTFDLTSVRQPIEEISKAAVELTLLAINGSQPPHKKIVMQPELIVRSSSRPPHCL